jgi:hypothetical protein
MVVQRMWLVRRGWRLLLTENRPSMSVSRISSSIVDSLQTGGMLMVGHLHGAFRSVELDVDIGSSALDYAALQKSEVPLHPLHPY